MTGSLLNPATADFSPEGVLPHGSVRPHARIRTSPVLPLAPPTWMERFLKGWVAAANACRDRQTELFALHRLGDRKLNAKRIYRGPIDDALERAARLRQRLKRS